MILHCNTLSHSLVHSGTQQRDRLLLSLIPGQLKIDDRSIEQLIAFAGTLSKHVRYWNDANQDGGDWLPFWEYDLTSLLAILAATDLEGPRTNYRARELEYYKLKRKQEQGANVTPNAVIDDLVTNPEYGIYGLALLIQNICQKVPPTHPLKTDICNLIAGTLKDPLCRLISFHKAIDPQAIQKYGMFIGGGACSDSWGMPNNAAFECINFVLPYEYIEELWKLFLIFYKALTVILGKVKKAFQTALRIRHDHQPHVALFITFLQLFKYIQSDLNGLLEKHLMFFYHDVLRLERRRLVPDKVHVVFEIAANLVRYKIPAGTELKANVDKAGKPMMYALEDELVISNAKLIEQQNLYVIKTIDATTQAQSQFGIYLPAADKRDGFEEAWPEGTKNWSALSGMPVYERVVYKLSQLQKLARKREVLPAAFREEREKYQTWLKKLEYFSGFSVSSAELWMNTGFDRDVELTFSFSQTNPPSADYSILDDFIVELSTEKGLVPLTFGTMSEIDSEGAVGFVPSQPTNTAEDYSGLSIIARESLTVYHIKLFDDFPSVLPVDDDLPPFLRFRSKEGRIAPAITSILISTTANGTLSNLQKGTPDLMFFENSDGNIDSGANILIKPGNGQFMAIKIPEIFYKKINLLEIENQSANNLTTDAVMVLNGTRQNPNAAGGLPDYTEGTGTLSIPDAFDFNALKNNRNGWSGIEFDLTLPQDVPAVVLRASDLFLRYQSVPVQIPLAGAPDRSTRLHHIDYFSSLGNWNASGESNRALRPIPEIKQPALKPVLGEKMLDDAQKNVTPDDANGNLFLGFENLVPNQTLSVLFQMADGTSNPDHYPPVVTWSYLTKEHWQEIPPQFILKDTTEGLEQTGIILFQIPDDITNNNTAIVGKDGRKDLYWLRVSATEIPDDQVFVDALPHLIDIRVHAAEALFEDNDNTEEHLDAGLLPGTIAALRFRDVNVKTVQQPYVSFQGRRSEKDDKYGYWRRVHERLRHRNRAVTLWDYERLVLEAFPEVSVIKCLTHTRRIYTARPGYVTLAVIPFPNKMVANGIYHPTFNAGELTRINKFVSTRNSYFVSGYGDPGFCCCEDDCQCDHNHNHLEVINARFEPVRLRLCVRFREGLDIPYYTKELNEALKTFLAPWAHDNKPLLFGVPISVTRLLQFLENLTYVDVILSLRLKHFSSQQIAEQFEDNVDWEIPNAADQVVPFTAASVLTTYLDKLNEDNPNVIDHVINVVATHEKCACEACAEDQEPVVAPPAPPDGVVVQPGDLSTEDRRRIDDLTKSVVRSWRNADASTAFRELHTTLNEMVERGDLKGKTVANPENGVEATDAYKIEKIKDGRLIQRLKVSVALSPGRFTTFEVTKPNP
ncbi:hypothetical protein [Chryseolinea soli]|uniref:Baseplate protein J-like domain-containing protein n=1 Tax=Chryseolinea soli TaxID=2321403 RepID=A0A385STX4_9BACT|nr:hypothetical protein [Chryseolinea soli]AYB33996.1 hypothetical protein D4L85_26965 [Chryseolinea soli]